MAAGTIFGVVDFLAGISILLMIVGAPLLQIYAHFREPILGGANGEDLYVEAGFYFVFLALLGSVISFLFPVGYDGVFLVDAIAVFVGAIVIGIVEASVLGILGIEPEDNDNDLVPVIWTILAGIVGYVRHFTGYDTSVDRSSATRSTTGGGGSTGSPSSSHSETGTRNESTAGTVSSTSSSTATSGTSNTDQSDSSDSGNRSQSTSDPSGGSGADEYEGSVHSSTHGLNVKLGTVTAAGTEQLLVSFPYDRDANQALKSTNVNWNFHDPGTDTYQTVLDGIVQKKCWFTDDSGTARDAVADALDITPETVLDPLDTGTHSQGGSGNTKVFEPDSSGVGDTEVFTPGSDTASTDGTGMGGSTCSNCGVNLSSFETATFCPNCGIEL